MKSYSSRLEQLEDGLWDSWKKKELIDFATSDFVGYDYCVVIVIIIIIIATVGSWRKMLGILIVLVNKVGFDTLTVAFALLWKIKGKPNTRIHCEQAV